MSQGKKLAFGRRAFWLLLAVAGAAACGAEPPPPASEPLPRIAVRVAPARRGEIGATREITGTVRAKQSASIAPSVMGTVKFLDVFLGSSVRKGDVLVRLRAGEIDQKARQTAAVLDQAKIDLVRAKSLASRGVVAKAELEAANSQYRIAEASHGEARVMQGYTVIKAPFSGVVTAKLANPGDQALPGRPLLVLEDPTELRLEATAPEAMITGLSLGQKLTVNIEAAHTKLEGRLAEISPSADPSTRTLLVKVDLPNQPGVHMGMFGRVELLTEKRKAIAIPKSALVRRGQLEIVFVARGGRAELRLVRSGRIQPDDIEISSGLDPDEIVIVTNADQLSDSQPIEVRQ